MQSISILLISAIVIMFTGCSYKAESLSLDEQAEYPALYKVNYDFECTIITPVGSSYKMTFAKNDVLPPYDLSYSKIATFESQFNKVMQNSPFGSYNKSQRLPKSTIGLLVWKSVLGSLSIAILPDGRIASDNYPFLDISQFSSEEVFMMQGSCDTKEDKTPFTLIENS